MENGAFLILSLIAIIWITDTFAYFVGRKYGKHRGIFKASPKKSLQGFLAGIIFAFIIYLVYSNMAGNHISTSSANIVVADTFVLTEHINEEGDYEKPVCKRLEEEGERYSQQDIVLDGKI